MVVSSTREILLAAHVTVRGGPPPPQGDSGTQGSSNLWLSQNSHGGLARPCACSGSEHRLPASRPEDSTGGFGARSGQDRAQGCTHSGPALSPTAAATAGGAPEGTRRVSAAPSSLHRCAACPTRPLPRDGGGEQSRKASCQPTQHSKG